MKQNTMEILSKYSNFAPVPVVRIANELGVDVYETDDLLDNQSGLIKKESDKYVIYVNSFHPATRKRFTIAHEIAHFLEHRDKIGDDYITGIKQPLKREDGPILDSEVSQMEIEANKIAAEILMPEKKFKEVWNICNTIEEVAEKFEVSVSAAAIRGDKLLRQTII